MSKHTPGPWFWDSDHTWRKFNIRADRKDDRGLMEHICTTNNLPQNILAKRDPEQAGANARLIAAAPDLLEALKGAESLIAHKVPETNESIGVLAMILKAIAKAEGKA